MACIYEEELFVKQGQVLECGCSACPYRTIESCQEVTESCSAACQPDSDNKNAEGGAKLKGSL